MVSPTAGAARLPRGGRWASTVGYVASGSAAAHGAVLLGAAAAGHHTLFELPHLAWLGAGVLLSGAGFAAAAARSGGRRFLARAVAAGVWGTAGLLLAGSCFVLLQLIQLAVTGTVSGRDGNSDWSSFVHRLCFLAVGALFVATAVSWRRRTAGHCSHCGRTHTPGTVMVVRPAPQAAPRSVRWTAYGGCATFVPYLTVHGLHAAGLLPSLDRLYTNSNPGAHSILVFIGFAVCLVGPAVVLLLALVRPWGMVFPRWMPWLASWHVPRFLPLVPVCLVAPTLALYGVGSIPYALASGHDIVGLGGAASLAFGGYGCALAIAAVSYQRRTRPRCVVPRNGAIVSKSGTD